MSEQQKRRLRYRLKTQGMCELDAWLAPLNDALEQENPQLLTQISQLLACEVPQLQAIMHGHQPIPKALQPWLSKQGSTRDS